MSNNYNGTLVSIEGIDCSGKSSIIEALHWRLDDSYEFTQEPSYGKYGQLVRNELRSESDPTASDFFLFCADRVDHCRSLIGPRLEKGKNIVTDRYNLSTYAYQSSVIEEDMDVTDPFDYVDGVVSEFLIEPDLTIVVDVPPETSMTRMSDIETEKYETRQRLERAREIYLSFADEKDYIEVVDGTQSKSNLIKECHELIVENES